MNTRNKGLAAFVLAAGLSGTAQAALHDRGGGLIYDDVLNVTWLQDANYAKTSGYDDDGLMTWDDARTWVANLSYFDGIRNATYTDWHLPLLIPANGTDFNYTTSYDGSTDLGYNIRSTNSALAYMFYVNLGNTGGYTPQGAPSGCYVSYLGDTCLDNVGPFANLLAYPSYWFNAPSGSENAWHFPMSDGGQNPNPRSDTFLAWAVRDGDVAAVPEADTWAMLLVGLGLVVAAVGRRHR